MTVLRSGGFDFMLTEFAAVNAARIFTTIHAWLTWLITPSAHAFSPAAFAGLIERIAVIHATSGVTSNLTLTLPSRQYLNVPSRLMV